MFFVYRTDVLTKKLTGGLARSVMGERASFLPISLKLFDNTCLSNSCYVVVVRPLDVSKAVLYRFVSLRKCGVMSSFLLYLYRNVLEYNLCWWYLEEWRLGAEVGGLCGHERVSAAAT